VKSRIRVLLLALAFFVAIPASGQTGLSASAHAATGDAPTSTPIKHFIFLMQENHSFDNYFGTYPGADGPPPGTCIPVDPTRPGGRCVEPFRVGGRAITDLGHSRLVHDEQFRGGQMDGFVAAAGLVGSENGRIAMGYYDDRDIPFYWNVADEYVLFDRLFTSAAGGSVANHMYWITGQSGNLSGETIPPGGFTNIPTIFDRLDAAGVSWKFYIQNYDPAITFRNPGTGDRQSQIVWAPLLAYPRYLDNPRLKSRIVDTEQFHDDLANGTLPEVAYMVPAGSSEHPPGIPREGQRFVRNLINALMRSNYWSTSAFMWAYDDWGGWYDHVPPPRVDESGYGFRTPALLVSPYARRGHIDSTTLDFTSALKFIEDNWGVEPLAKRDRAAKSIAGAFDFTKPPRPAVLLPGQRATAEVVAPHRKGAVYPMYLMALVVALVLFAAARWNLGLGELRGRLGRLRLRAKREGS